MWEKEINVWQLFDVFSLLSRYWVCFYRALSVSCRLLISVVYFIILMVACLFSPHFQLTRHDWDDVIVRFFSQGLRDAGRTDIEPLGYGVRGFHFEDLALITCWRLFTANAGISKPLKCTKHLDQPPQPQLSGVKMQWTKPLNPRQQEKTAAESCSTVFTLVKFQIQIMQMLIFCLTRNISWSLGNFLSQITLDSKLTLFCKGFTNVTYIFTVQEMYFYWEFFSSSISVESISLLTNVHMHILVLKKNERRKTPKFISLLNNFIFPSGSSKSLISLPFFFFFTHEQRYLLEF